MFQPPFNTGYLFVDSLICGMMGGTIAWLLGEPLPLWAMLSALFGPVFILWASRLTYLLPPILPGRQSGTYEFAAFALCVAILVGLHPFAQ